MIATALVTTFADVDADDVDVDAIVNRVLSLLLLRLAFFFLFSFY